MEGDTGKSDDDSIWFKGVERRSSRQYVTVDFPFFHLQMMLMIPVSVPMTSNDFASVNSTLTKQERQV